MVLGTDFRPSILMCPPLPPRDHFTNPSVWLVFMMRFSCFLGLCFVYTSSVRGVFAFLRPFLNHPRIHPLEPCLQPLQHFGFGSSLLVPESRYCSLLLPKYLVTHRAHSPLILAARTRRWHSPLAHSALALATSRRGGNLIYLCALGKIEIATYIALHCVAVSCTKYI